VVLGAWAAAYFCLEWEPSVAAGWAAGGLALAVAAILAPNLWLCAGLELGLVAAQALGFGLARLRSEQVAAPVPCAAAGRRGAESGTGLCVFPAGLERQKRGGSARQKTVGIEIARLKARGILRTGQGRGATRTNST